MGGLCALLLVAWVVYLDNGGVQRVEVQEQHILVIEALAWLQHEATSIGSLAALRAAGGAVFLLWGCEWGVTACEIVVSPMP